MKTTEKDLQNIVDKIAPILGVTTSKKEAIDAGHNKWLTLAGGGAPKTYRLAYVNVDGGGHNSIFNGFYLPGSATAPVMEHILWALYGGLIYNDQKENQQRIKNYQDIKNA